MVPVELLQIAGSESAIGDYTRPWKELLELTFYVA